MTESNLLRRIQLELSKMDCRLFRNNTGQSWVGSVVHRDASVIILKNYRPFHSGLCKGSSDLIGWTSVGKFLAIEGKTTHGIATVEQENFIHQVNISGGVGGICWSVSDAVRVVNGKR